MFSSKQLCVAGAILIDGKHELIFEPANRNAHGLVDNGQVSDNFISNLSGRAHSVCSVLSTRRTPRAVLAHNLPYGNGLMAPYK